MKLLSFSKYHLATKYFKVVANFKKSVATDLDLHIFKNSQGLQEGCDEEF